MEKQLGGAGGFSGEKSPESAEDNKAAVDLFYEKLEKLNESSGLSLVFNLREAMFDLHLLYKEVIKRGGFYQVTKKGKWDDVALESNSKSRVTLSATQLQSVYKMLVFQYELMYFRNQATVCPAKTSLGKRKQCNVSHPSSTSQRGNREGSATRNKSSVVIVSPNSNDKEGDPNVPVRPRSGYHIFLRLEARRLKMVLGESSSTQNLRELANDAWKHLPEIDKLPYFEASKMDRERYDREMAAYKQLSKNYKGKSPTIFSTTTPRMLNFSKSKSKSIENDDVYRVSLQEDSENLNSPDKSMIELAFEVMKNAESHDSIFQFDGDNSSPE